MFKHRKLGSSTIGPCPNKSRNKFYNIDKVKGASINLASNPVTQRYFLYLLKNRKILPPYYSITEQ